MVTGTDHIRAMKDQAEHSHQCKFEPLTLSKFDPSKKMFQGLPKRIETDTTSLQTDNDLERRKRAEQLAFSIRIWFSQWWSVT
jgi:hypothetical protein